MTFPEFRDYKAKSRAETARRVRERSDSVNPSRGLDEALDDRIEREEEQPPVLDVELQRDHYRQAALELHAAIRAGLDWIGIDGEPAVAHSSMRKAADKWLPVLKALEEGLKVPDPSSGGNQGRGPDRSPTEEGASGGS